MSIKEIKKFDKLCGIWKGFDKGKHRLVILDITSSLNTVIGVFIDNPSENYNAQGFFYNSLERHQQGLQMINPRTEEFLIVLIIVFNNFVLWLKNCSCNKRKFNCGLLPLVFAYTSLMGTKLMNPFFTMSHYQFEKHAPFGFGR